MANQHEFHAFSVDDLIVPFGPSALPLLTTALESDSRYCPLLGLFALTFSHVAGFALALYSNTRSGTKVVLIFVSNVYCSP